MSRMQQTQQIQRSIGRARDELRSLLDDDRFADDASEAMKILDVIEDKIACFERLGDISAEIADGAADVIATRINAAMSPHNVAFAPQGVAGLDMRGLDLGCFGDMGEFLYGFGFVAGPWIGIFVDECRRRFPAPQGQTALLTEEGFESLLRFLKETGSCDDEACDIQFECSVGESDGVYSPWQAFVAFPLRGTHCKVQARFFVTTPYDDDGESLPPERTIRAFVVKGEERLDAIIEHVCDLCSDARPGKLEAAMPGVVALTRAMAKFISQKGG